MAQIGILEAEQPVTSRPRFYLDKPTVKSLIEQKKLKPCGPRLARLIKETIAEIRAWIDGPLGIGNLLPFAKRRSDGSKLHYWIGPQGLPFHGLYQRRDDDGIMQVRRRELAVSRRVPDEVALSQAVAAYNFRLRLRPALL